MIGGMAPGLKPVSLMGRLIVGAKARIYLRSKGKYGDSGCARMTSKKDRSRFPTGMTNKSGEGPGAEEGAEKVQMSI